jgi:hypothetical protein
MKSKLEKKWWFQLPVCVMAALLTSYVMDSAGITHPYKFSGWVIYALCFAGVERGLSFALWLVILSVTPSDKVLERTR